MMVTRMVILIHLAPFAEFLLKVKQLRARDFTVIAGSPLHNRSRVITWKSDVNVPRKHTLLPEAEALENAEEELSYDVFWS
jgi:hypothetical protein